MLFATGNQVVLSSAIVWCRDSLSVFVAVTLKSVSVCEIEGRESHCVFVVSVDGLGRGM